MAFTMKRSGMEWLDADAPAGTPEDLSEVVQEVRRLRPAAVIVDAPEAGDDYLRGYREGRRSRHFDRSSCRRRNSRRGLIINPLLGPGRDGYSFEPGAQLLLGARYAIVRPEIRRARPARRRNSRPPFGPWLPWATTIRIAKPSNWPSNSWQCRRSNAST